MVVDPDTWHKVFERDRGCCRYCGVDLLANFSAYCSATVDHVIARSAGGTDDLSNLVLACSGCNGHLSRSGALRTFEERKSFAQAQRAKGLPVYQRLLEQLRKGEPLQSNNTPQADGREVPQNNEASPSPAAGREH